MEKSYEKNINKKDYNNYTTSNTCINNNFFTALNTVIKGDTEKTRVVINNRNVTLKNDAYIDGDIVYLSKQDVKNFFDKYIYEEAEKIVTTYEDKIAEIEYDSNIVTINGLQKQIDTTIKIIEEKNIFQYQN